jgi:hypothetical protein
MNKWITVVNHDEDQTYYDAVGISKQRAQELMAICEEAIRNANLDLVSQKWDYVLERCDSFEEAIFVIYKLGEFAGSQRFMMDATTQTEVGEQIAKAIESVMGGSVKIQSIVKVGKPIIKKNKEDDTEIKGPEHA